MYPNYMQGYQNQYITNQVQRCEIVKVSGENGARAYQMAPNSSALLLDETDPIVWLKTTDGAGYPSLTPYTITPKKPEKQIDVAGLEARIERLEGLLNESNRASVAE